jgi:hypothetical protein
MITKGTLFFTISALICGLIDSLAWWEVTRAAATGRIRPGKSMSVIVRSIDPIEFQRAYSNHRSTAVVFLLATTTFAGAALVAACMA